MKNVYPVLFTKTDDCILIEVPDFDILTEGNDMNDAIEMARDAIELKCVEMEDLNMKIPNPSKLEDVNVNAGTFCEDGETIISFVDIDSAIYRKKIDTNHDIFIRGDVIETIPKHKEINERLAKVILKRNGLL